MHTIITGVNADVINKAARRIYGVPSKSGNLWVMWPEIKNQEREPHSDVETLNRVTHITDALLSDSVVLTLSEVVITYYQLEYVKNPGSVKFYWVGEDASYMQLLLTDSGNWVNQPDGFLDTVMKLHDQITEVCIARRVKAGEE